MNGRTKVCEIFTDALGSRIRSALLSRHAMIVVISVDWVTAMGTQLFHTYVTTAGESMCVCVCV